MCALPFSTHPGSANAADAFLRSRGVIARPVGGYGLPHCLRITVGTADDLADESRQEVVRFAASGFRDFTRIAASDPVMWRDIFLNNREALLEMLARFMEDAQAMSRAVRWGDAAYIEDKVERGRKIRRSLIEVKQA